MNVTNAPCRNTTLSYRYNALEAKSTIDVINDEVHLSLFVYFEFA